MKKTDACGPAEQLICNKSVRNLFGSLNGLGDGRSSTIKAMSTENSFLFGGIFSFLIRGGLG